MVVLQTPEADLTGSLPGVFHNWQGIASLAAEGEVSFGLETLEVARWQMELPPDHQAADDLLAQSEAQVRSTQKALDAAPARLDTLIASLGSREAGPLSFSLPSEAAATLPPAESELLSWLEATQPEAVSFGLPALPSKDLLDAGLQVQKALDGMLQQVLYLAWVETRLGERTLARTVVNWGGDSDTVWSPLVPSDELSLHRRSLGLAVVSRLALLRLILTVTQGAAKISVLIAAPGANLLALPAAWKFVNRVLAEIEAYKSSISKAQET